MATDTSDNDNTNSANNANLKDFEKIPILIASPSPLNLSTPELSEINDTEHGYSIGYGEISILNSSPIIHNLSTPVKSESTDVTNSSYDVDPREFH